jgi:hypothetical protein
LATLGKFAAKMRSILATPLRSVSPVPDPVATERRPWAVPSIRSRDASPIAAVCA